MATTSLSLLQTGYIKTTNSSASWRFRYTKEGDMNNDGDMPLDDNRGEYTTNHNDPIVIFDSSAFTGTTAAEVSSATLTLTIAETQSTTNLPSRCRVQVWIPASDTEYSLPMAHNYDIYDGDATAIDGVLRQGHGYLNPSLTSTDPGGAGDYSYGGFTVHDLSSQDWSVGQTLTFDITAQLKAYFRNPHRVNNGQVVITLAFDGFSGFYYQDGISNSVHLHGENGSAPPTLGMTYETKSRTRVTLPTSALGSDFVWHGGSWRSDGSSTQPTQTVNGVAYERIQAAGASADSYSSGYNQWAFAIFPINSSEVTQGETLDAAILSFTGRGGNGYNGTSATGPAKVYGDKSNTPSYPTSYSDLSSKTLTTAFVYDKQGSNTDSYTGPTRSAYQLDVTDIINEILANGSWDGSAIQFVLKNTTTATYSNYYPYYQSGGAETVFVPVLSFLRTGGGGGGSSVAILKSLMMPSLGDMD